MTRSLRCAGSLWTLAAAGVVLFWAVRRYPYGPANRGDLSPVNLLPPAVGATLFVLVLVAAGLLFLLLRRPRPAAVRTVGWVVAALLAVVVPGAAPLALTGYAPLLILGAPFGVWRDVDPGAFGPDFQGEVLAPERWRRWGRRAVGVATLVPLFYAVTRYAWVLHVPLGISHAELDELWRTGGVWAGASLASAAVGGSILTLGLVQRWGETFPRWIPWLRGRRVPVRLAVVPASYVALVVLAGGIGVVTSPLLLDAARDSFWAFAPMLLWPVWAVALGAATYAYQARRTIRAC